MKEDLLADIGGLEALAVELETELSRRPAISPDSGGEGELDKAEFLEAWLKGQGLPDLERFDAPDPRAKGGVRPNLILTIPGKDESLSRIWIMSHLDVVPPGEMGLWKSDPWGVVKAEGGSRSDGSPLGKRLVGRGVEDNQQGLVSSVLAALALVKRGVIPHRTVKLLFAADEEMGSSYGIGWLIRNHRELFRQTDMALIPDGGDSRGASIEVAEKHLIWARFTLRGRQSHGSRPDLGINAHLAGADLALKLHYGLSEKFSARDPLFEPNYSTFQPTKREANVPNINTIPGEDVFCMDMRVLPRYSAREVFAEIDRIKGEIEKRYGVVVTYSTPQCMESRPTAVDAPLIRILSGAVEEVYGVKPKPIGIGGGTVGAFLRNEGMDAAVWCRIDDTAHQPNEYALLDNILGDAKVMALFMLSG